MKVLYQGKDIEAQEIDVVTSNEPWSEYQLADGKVLCSKNVLLSVYKALNEKTPDGEPLYIVKGQGIIKVK